MDGSDDGSGSGKGSNGSSNGSGDGSNCDDCNGSSSSSIVGAVYCVDNDSTPGAIHELLTDTVRVVRLWV
jgi:hypothetical protein